MDFQCPKCKKPDGVIKRKGVIKCEECGYVLTEKDIEILMAIKKEEEEKIAKQKELENSRLFKVKYEYYKDGQKQFMSSWVTANNENEAIQYIHNRHPRADITSCVKTTKQQMETDSKGCLGMFILLTIPFIIPILLFASKLL